MITNPMTNISNPNLVTSFKVKNRTYERRLVDCGKSNCQRCGGDDTRKPSHGPYWYLCIARKSKWYRVYLGKELDTGRFIKADGRIDWEAIRHRKPQVRKIKAKKPTVEICPMDRSKPLADRTR